MKITILTGFFFLPFLIFNTQAQSVTFFQTLPNLSIRALEVIDDSTVWFAADRGVWGYTENGGKSWHIDSLKADSVYPEFRSMAVLDKNTVLLLSISSPAYLFRSDDKGKTWNIVYKNEHKDIFFDSMKFWDKENGMAIADPIDGKMQLINTRNGGKTWKEVKQSSCPKMKKGEAFFASSNTCFELKDNFSWFATGGKSARVFRSVNGGRSHTIHETPLPKDETMSGIYSIDFWDTKTGAVAGGNYDKADTNIIVLSITQDYGNTWEIVRTEKPVFGSCVQFLSEDTLVITGKPGTFLYSISNKQWKEILDTKENSCGFHTLRVAPDRKIIWLAGGDGRVGKIELN